MTLVSAVLHLYRDIAVVSSDGTTRCFGSKVESNVSDRADADHGNALALGHVDGTHNVALESD